MSMVICGVAFILSPTSRLFQYIDLIQCPYQNRPIYPHLTSKEEWIIYLKINVVGT